VSCYRSSCRSGTVDPVGGWRKRSPSRRRTRSPPHLGCVNPRKIAGATRRSMPKDFPRPVTVQDFEDFREHTAIVPHAHPLSHVNAKALWESSNGPTTEQSVTEQPSLAALPLQSMPTPHVLHHTNLLDNRFRDNTRFRTHDTDSPFPHESHRRCVGFHGFLRNVSTCNVQGRADAIIAVRLAVPF